MSLEQFARNQEKFRQTLSSALGASPPFQQYEDQIRQNMSMFKQAMDMFSPFPATAPNSQKTREEPKASPERPGAGEQAVNSELETLRSQMAAMQTKLDELTKKS